MAKPLISTEILGKTKYYADWRALSEEIEKDAFKATKTEADQNFMPRVRADAPFKSGALRSSIMSVKADGAVYVKIGSGTGRSGENVGRYRGSSPTSAVWYANANHWGRRRLGRGRGMHAIKADPYAVKHIKSRIRAFDSDMKRMTQRNEQKATRRLNR